MKNRAKTVPLPVLALATCTVICVGVVVYWSFFYYRSLHWQPGPEVKFSVADLPRVRWTDQSFQAIATNRIIAIEFDQGNPLEHPGRMVTDPRTIYRIAQILVKTDRRQGSSTVGGVRMRIVFEDRTGVSYFMHIDFDKRSIMGTNWQSEELFPIFEDIWLRNRPVDRQTTTSPSIQDSPSS